MNTPNDKPSILQLGALKLDIITQSMSEASDRNAKRPGFGVMTAKPGFKGMEFTLQYPKAWPNTLIGRDGTGRLRFEHIDIP